MVIIRGVAKLQHHWGAKVYGPAHEKLPFKYQALEQGHQISWLGLNFQTLDVPGHTAGHIAYFAEPEGQEPLLFVVIRFSLVAVVACLRHCTTDAPFFGSVGRTAWRFARLLRTRVHTEQFEICQRRRATECKSANLCQTLQRP